MDTKTRTRRTLSLLVVLGLVTLVIAPASGFDVTPPSPTPPKANNIIVTPNTIAPGGTVTVTFNVTSSSDIPLDSNSIIQFYAPSGANYGRIFSSTSGTTRSLNWSAQIQIPAAAESGKYSLSVSVPFDANGLSGGFVQVPNALMVIGVTSAPMPTPSPTPSSTQSPIASPTSNPLDLIAISRLKSSVEQLNSIIDKLRACLSSAKKIISAKKGKLTSTC